MSKPLVIVESPTKERSLKKYLGNQYKVTSTVGHIKDLPEKEIGIDVDHDFMPQYVTIKGKQKVIKSLKSAAGDSDDIYLAPDPDREGEAIAWHTAQDVLKKKGKQAVSQGPVSNELTKKGHSGGGCHRPRPLNLKRNLKAQQARRILDRLVGIPDVTLAVDESEIRGLSARAVFSQWR